MVNSLNPWVKFFADKAKGKKTEVFSGGRITMWDDALKENKGISDESLRRVGVLGSNETRKVPEYEPA